MFKNNDAIMYLFLFFLDEDVIFSIRFLKLNLFIIKFSSVDSNKKLVTLSLNSFIFISLKGDLCSHVT
jgi:hypothetical protein